MATLNENIQRIENAKASIKTSIEAKGVTVPAETKIDGYSALIDSIPAGGDFAGIDMSKYGYKKDDLVFNSIEEDMVRTQYWIDRWNEKPDKTVLDSFTYNDDELVIAPPFDTSEITDLSDLCGDCNNLVMLPLYDCSANTKEIDLSYSKNIKYVGGFKNQKKSIRLARAYSGQHLTRQSCLNIFNTIADLKALGLPQAFISLHNFANFRLTPEDRAIAENKGWKITVIYD